MKFPSTVPNERELVAERRALLAETITTFPEVELKVVEGLLMRTFPLTGAETWAAPLTPIFTFPWEVVDTPPTALREKPFWGVAFKPSTQNDYVGE